MRTLPLLMAILVAASAVDGQQPPRDPGRPDAATTPTGKASIAGVITMAGTGTPARRARVSLSGAELRGSMARTTDNEGKFLFTQLPAGRYTLSVSKPGYVNITYGQHRPGLGRTGTPIQLADGQQFEARLQLPRGSAITGIVVDENGEVTQGVNVRALRWTMSGGQRTLQMVGGATTDDRGIYRVYNLQPADYVICATPRNQAGNEAERMLAEISAAQRQAEVMAQRDAAEARAMLERITTLRSRLTSDLEEQTGHAPTCFPGTATPSAATTITVGAGEERPGVDFQLQLVRLATIEGVVVNPFGANVQNVQLTMRPMGEAAGADTRSARAEPDGRFRYTGVAPGQYTISARATMPQAGGRGRGGAPSPSPLAKVEEVARGAEAQRLWATVDISVDGRNMSNIALQLMPGMTISGQIAFSGTEARPADLARVRVTASPVASGGNMNLSSVQGAVDANGRFKIANVIPGKYRITASNPGPNWYVESAVVGDQDTLDFPIEIRPQQNLTDVTVTFSDRQSEFSGTIVNQRNEPVSMYTVIVFPADQRFWTPQSRRIMTSRPGTDGRFTLRGLPAGDYRLATVFDPEPGSWYDPAFLQQLQGSSTAISILAGEKKLQDVRVSTQ